MSAQERSGDAIVTLAPIQSPIPRGTEHRTANPVSRENLTNDHNVGVCVHCADGREVVSSLVPKSTSADPHGHKSISFIPQYQTLILSLVC